VTGFADAVQRVLHFLERESHPGDGRSQTELFRVADGRLYARKAARATKLRSVS
jgi:hypothetical protein